VLKLKGAAVLVLVFAVSAQAQTAHNSALAHFTATPANYSNQGAGGGGGASSGGSRALPHFPPAHLAVRTVSGSNADYIPSTFVSYKAAVAEGQAVLAARPEPLGTSALAGSKPAPRTAKIHIVQGQDGLPEILTTH
jgi:hypothetical protein